MIEIETRIQQIIDNLGKSIIVLKGFDVTALPEQHRYFNTIHISYYDQVDLELLKKYAVQDIFQNQEFIDQYKWMTIEEYQLFKEYPQLNSIPIAILENNLYNKQFPYRNTLSNVDDIYHYLYYQEDTELEPDQEKLHQNVSYFYGQIDYSKQSNRYFVTYPQVPRNVDVYYLYPENPIEVEIVDTYPADNAQQVELSENETAFLDIEAEILNQTNLRNIILVLSGPIESLPNKYLERLNILRRLADLNLYFINQSIKRQIIPNQTAYTQILKELGDFDSFRSIPFYKNIEAHSKETIEISQAQLIDDIVSQAELAITGDPFRDIYITASTGSGKSLIYQIATLFLAKKYAKNKPLTIVISPLIGLMTDQVASMQQLGVTSSATINGNTPPFEKEQVIEKIQKQEIDLLYLSPETLQARSDIRMLIGDRNIGAVIVDEAHIVTTWGKSFRADYWYLGIYLAKLRKKYRFPIVTFTATAIYGGKEDMYLDTRKSLNMIRPISYFGVVRRDNIKMVVRSSEKAYQKADSDYRKAKSVLAINHLKQATRLHKKTLLYFPTIKLLNGFYSILKQNEPEIASKTGRYYGSLTKEEKDEVLKEFQTGALEFVLATKAFGMGIDIPDITNVYHYAPTGNVVDYIQEVGRAARNTKKVPVGFGLIDFLNHDMNEVKKLYGMSAIRKTQILDVMKKILSVYHDKGDQRNLIMSPEDFKYIFVQTKGDEDSLDNKVKTALLMIEKDFSSPQKLGYPPFAARPRSLFGNDLLFVTAENETQFLKSRLSGYFTKLLDIQSKSYAAVYQVNLSGIWEKHYRDMSYPSFKYALHNNAELEKLKHKTLFGKFNYTTGIEVTLRDDESIDDVLSQYRRILTSFEEFIDSQHISDRQFTVNNLGDYFMRSLKISDKFEARAFAQTIINSAFEFSKIKKIKFISERANSELTNQRYKVEDTVDLFTQFILESINSVLRPIDNFAKTDSQITSFAHRANSADTDAKIAALGIGEARKLVNYQVIGGNTPQIYLRINSVFPLEQAIRKGNLYQNSILQDVQIKHYTSVEMLKYLFTKKIDGATSGERIEKYSTWFWDNIEDYFMGRLPNEVKEALAKDAKE